MTFRVTPQHFVANTIRYSQLRNRSLLKLQQQVSTGLRIQKPSDDPSQMVSLITSRARVSRLDVDLANIDVAEGKLNQSVGQLQASSVALTSALNAALRAPQALPNEREALAAEVQGVIDSMLQIANSSNGGGALFGGTSSQLNPFSVVETNGSGRPARVTYTGAIERSSVVIGAIAVDVHYAGSEIFGTTERGTTVFLGDTGVVAGTGTDSATNRGSLIVSHAGTEYSGNSGLSPGLSSDQDTLVGVGKLSFDAAAGTISMGAGEVFFQPGDGDVRVVGLHGEVVHVDTSGLVGAGTIEVVGHGTLSTDGGASSVEIDFSSNQVVVDSTTGAVTNVDTSNVKKSGSEHVEYLGTSDVFQTLINLRDDLLNTRGLNPSDDQATIQRDQNELKRVQAQILKSMSEQSVSLDNLKDLKTRSEDDQLETQIQISDIESVDFVEAAIRLQEEQNALQYTYAASVGLIDLSILDFLQ